MFLSTDDDPVWAGLARKFSDPELHERDDLTRADPSQQIVRWDKLSPCSMCQEPLLWVTTDKGKRLPLNPTIRDEKWVWRRQPDGTWSQWHGSGEGHLRHVCKAQP